MEIDQSTLYENASVDINKNDRLFSQIHSYAAFLWKHLELLFWLTALFMLACMHPGESHFSLCIFKWLGISFCPGCGIGHSIYYLFQGNILASWQSHPLGIPAFVIISHRVIRLFPVKFFKNDK